MRFQVPQFIEVESKIFGPLTLKQFIYLAGGAGIIFLLYISLPFFIMVFFAAPAGIFALALAFYKINNQPFIKVAENAFSYFISSKIYVWKKEKIQSTASLPPGFIKKKKSDQELIPRLTHSKLKDLAWSLDIKHKIK